MDLKDIRLWSQEKRVLRLKELVAALKKDPPDDTALIHEYPPMQAKTLDEIILIALEVLRVVIKEKEWQVSPLELFEGVFLKNYLDESFIHKWISLRFRETIYFVDKYKAGNRAEKARLSAQLISRGMI